MIGPQQRYQTLNIRARRVPGILQAPICLGCGGVVLQLPGEIREQFPIGGVLIGGERLQRLQDGVGACELRTQEKQRGQPYGATGIVCLRLQQALHAGDGVVDPAASFLQVGNCFKNGRIVTALILGFEKRDAIRRTAQRFVDFRNPLELLCGQRMQSGFACPCSQKCFVIVQSGCQPQYRLPRIVRIGSPGKQQPLLECFLRLAVPFGRLGQLSAPEPVIGPPGHGLRRHTVGIGDIAVGQEHVIGQRVKLLIIGTHGGRRDDLCRMGRGHHPAHYLFRQ